MANDEESRRSVYGYGLSDSMWWWHSTHGSGNSGHFIHKLRHRHVIPYGVMAASNSCSKVRLTDFAPRSKAPKLRYLDATKQSEAHGSPILTQLLLPGLFVTKVFLGFIQNRPAFRPALILARMAWRVTDEHHTTFLSALQQPRENHQTDNRFKNTQSKGHAPHPTHRNPTQPNPTTPHLPRTPANLQARHQHSTRNQICLVGRPSTSQEFHIKLSANLKLGVTSNHHPIPPRLAQCTTPPPPSHHAKPPNPPKHGQEKPMVSKPGGRARNQGRWAEFRALWKLDKMQKESIWLGMIR
ncbi:predicted protein [Plenodomus lingam JN3]|uniref:Predicted protein n=1 Tax=Leptosphaeria maculans (strain JN3 / isolate v23.1.3 / race Av1-4-5-6-7-8) TaxID=985895 RepID=E4ZW49_LEPMJ|nr:predicted protein [Plenodomus lingam JN3]CBX95825.1 predicted protein [Plenodomus lingam JN3]